MLLLNSTLTVRKNNLECQNQGWKDFTDEIIKVISLKKEMWCLCCGEIMQRISKLIDHKKHLVLLSGHPSPLSANRGYWFGNSHFSKTNKYFKKKI